MAINFKRNGVVMLNPAGRKEIVVSIRAVDIDQPTHTKIGQKLFSRVCTS